MKTHYRCILQMHIIDAYYRRILQTHIIDAYYKHILQEQIYKHILSKMLTDRQISLYKKIAQKPDDSFVKQLVCTSSGEPIRWQMKRGRGRPRQQWCQSVFNLLTQAPVHSFSACVPSPGIQRCIALQQIRDIQGRIPLRAPGRSLGPLFILYGWRTDAKRATPAKRATGELDSSCQRL